MELHRHPDTTLESMLQRVNKETTPWSQKMGDVCAGTREFGTSLLERNSHVMSSTCFFSIE